MLLMLSQVALLCVQEVSFRVMGYSQQVQFILITFSARTVSAGPRERKYYKLVICVPFYEKAAVTRGFFQAGGRKRECRGQNLSCTELLKLHLLKALTAKSLTISIH